MGYGSKSKQELADAYGVSPDTMRRWIKRIEKKEKLLFPDAKILPPIDVAKIVEVLGETEGLMNNKSEREF